MAYMNDDLPYDEYIEKVKLKEYGRNRPKNARFGRKELTKVIDFCITPAIRSGIDKLIEKGLFPNTSEFMRYLIIRFFEENKEWLE